MSLPAQLLLAAIGGGGAWKLLEYLLDYAGLRKGARAKFRDDLLARVKALQQRVDQLDSALQEEQRARVKAELRNDVSERRIKLLVEELNRLRAKLDMDPLDPEEFLVTDVPFRTTLTADTHD